MKGVTPGSAGLLSLSPRQINGNNGRKLNAKPKNKLFRKLFINVFLCDGTVLENDWESKTITL